MDAFGALAMASSLIGNRDKFPSITTYDLMAQTTTGTTTDIDEHAIYIVSYTSMGTPMSQIHALVSPGSSIVLSNAIVQMGTSHGGVHGKVTLQSKTRVIVTLANTTSSLTYLASGLIGVD